MRAPIFAVRAADAEGIVTIDNHVAWHKPRGGNYIPSPLVYGDELYCATSSILTCYDGWFPEPFRVLSLKGAEIVVWINGRRGSVEDFIVRTATFQGHLAVIATNQAYGAGTMIAQWPANVLAFCPEKKEDYITATINLRGIRQVRAASRNFQQRRPELYGKLVEPQESESAASIWLKTSSFVKCLRTIASVGHLAQQRPSPLQRAGLTSAFLPAFV